MTYIQTLAELHDQLREDKTASDIIRNCGFLVVTHSDNNYEIVYITEPDTLRDNETWVSLPPDDWSMPNHELLSLAHNEIDRQMESIGADSQEA
jgi:hypothetical protein